MTAREHLDDGSVVAGSRLVLVLCGRRSRGFFGYVAVMSRVRRFNYGNIFADVQFFGGRLFDLMVSMNLLEEYLELVVLIGIEVAVVAAVLFATSYILAGAF